MLRRLPWALTLVPLLLTACGTTNPVETTTSSASGAGSGSATASASASPATSGSTTATASPTATQAAGPVTVTDGRDRTVTVDAPATRVVALEWGEAETLVSLDVQLVGLADPTGFGTWNKSVTLPSDVKDVGLRSEPSVESILALQPDLVVLNGADTSGLDKQLEGKVPVAFTKGSTAGAEMERLRSDVELLAELTGRTAEGAALLAEMDSALAAAKLEVTAGGAAGTPMLMADGWKEGSVVNIRVFAKGSMLSTVAEEIGLTNAWTKAGDKDWGLLTTDVEGLTVLTDPRTRLVYSASQDDVFATALKDNAIWKRLPFVTSSKITHLTPGTWTFGGPKSVSSMAEQLAAAATA